MITDDNVLLIMGSCVYGVLLITFCTMWYRMQFKEDIAAAKRRKAAGSRH